MEFPPDTNCNFSFKDCTPLGALLKIPQHIVSTLLTPEIIFTSNKYSNKFRFRALRSPIGRAKPAEVIITEVPAVDLRSKRNILDTLGRCFNTLLWTRAVCLHLDLSVNCGTIREADWLRFATSVPTLESLEIRFTRSSRCEEEQAVQLLLKGLERERTEPCFPRLRRLVFPAIDGSQLCKELSEILKRCNRQRKTQGLPSTVVNFLGGHVELVMEFESSD
ncbi:hypothetical protein BD410DRAFT_793588 [Rickenella mellea]|uniref:Uncharacterized protein n=1 Tax=Rickenella mellea TaxID=50990 RepID=A0A4Y7PRP5_9AGAM|nr:hypothetical protein BD410DRAFT_793588 [Rickenella mellea]